MQSQTDTLTETGVGGRLNWLIGGALGGVTGAGVFGFLLWSVDPTIVTESIPQIYGLEGGGATGWVFHLLHGVVLGIVFGFLITRSLILGTLMADVETPFIDRLSPHTRIIGAGLVYGLTVWVLLPGVILTVLVSVGNVVEPIPLVSAYSLVGHLFYGMLLGALVSVFIDLETDVRESEAPFEEPSNRR